MKETMKLTTFSLHILLCLIVYNVSPVCGQEEAESDMSDPLKIGQIDPVSLEVASTYVFIVPFVIFVFGVLFIPVSLVLIFLFVTPFLVPSGNPERARRSSDWQLFKHLSSPSSPATHPHEEESNYYTILSNILSAVQSHGHHSHN